MVVFFINFQFFNFFLYLYLELRLPFGSTLGNGIKNLLEPYLYRIGGQELILSVSPLSTFWSFKN